jgi:hypothetical protein
MVPGGRVIGAENAVIAHFLSLDWSAANIPARRAETKLSQAGFRLISAPRAPHVPEIELNAGRLGFLPATRIPRQGAAAMD